MKFIDSAKIHVESGAGGNGHVSFRREKFVPNGGPDGGNGGKGGDVVLEADPHTNTLLEFNFVKKYKAEDGHHGQKSRKTGKNGKDIIIKIPAGTLVKDIESGDVIVDLANKGDQHVLIKGGWGGKGNSEFANATRQAPRFATDGKPAIEQHLELELKLLANVGIVGFPNAGKSTLISSISAAKPKVADYPFTTLVPNLGVVKFGQYNSFTVADIPGLIEGASEGKGLGIQFLRHVERCQVLLYLLDAASDDPEKEYNTLKNELRKFNPEMLEKAEIIAFSKMDTLIEEQHEEVNSIKINGKTPLKISSVTRLNLDKLTQMLYNTIQANE
ncbi:GTPase ObgE [Candidatus Kapabacteria bacterium]|nr:GTPase ObgE [Candidatus Kapabacteria bacterium]